MSAPSLVRGGFFSLGKHQYNNILCDDFATAKPETYEISTTTKKNNTIKYKFNTQTFIHADSKEKKIKGNDEVTLGINLCSKSSIETRIQRSGDIRYHLDGKIKAFQKFIPVFFALKTNFFFDRFWTRFGSYFINDNFETQTRIEKDYAGKLYLSTRNFFKTKNFKIGMVGIVDIQDKQLNRYDAIVNYKHDKFDFVLKYLSSLEGKVFSISKLIAGMAYTHNQKIQFATRIVKKDTTPNVLFGVQYACGKCGSIFKAKTNEKGIIDFSLKAKLTCGNELVLSTGFDLKDTKKLLKNPCSITIPYGIKFNLNI